MLRAVAALLAAAISGAPAWAAVYWDGATGAWANPTNWSTAADVPTPDPAAAPGSGDDATFNISPSNAPTVVYLGAAAAVRILTFTSQGATTLLGGAPGSPAHSALSSYGGLTVNAGAGPVTLGDSAATPTARVDLRIGTSTFANNSTNRLIVANGVNSRGTSGTTTLTLGGTGTTVVRGVVGNGTGSNKVAIQKTGAGTLVFTGLNTYTGTTTIDAGTLQVGDGTTDGTIYHSANVVNNAALVIQMVQATVRSYAHVISGTGSLTKLGATAYRLDGPNTFTGAVQVGGGTLTVGNNLALGATNGATTVSAGAVLALADGVRVAAETVTVNGDGGTSYNGALQAAAGAAARWDGAVRLGDASARIGAGLGGTLTLGGDIRDSGAFRDVYFGPGNGAGADAASGAVVLAGAAKSYTGATRIIRGTLRLGTANVLPAGTTLDVDYSSAAERAVFDLAGFDQTVGGLRRSGAAAGAGGSRIVNSGAGPATLTVNQSFATTFSGVIVGTIALVKSGAGTLALTGANAWAGDTMVLAGTLALGTACLSDAHAVHVSAGATLRLDFAGENRVARLVVAGAEKPAGVYSSATTPALAGTGALRVLQGPEAGTVVIVR